MTGGQIAAAVAGWLVFSLLNASAAHRQGRDYAFALGASILLSPLAVWWYLVAAGPLPRCHCGRVMMIVDNGKAVCVKDHEGEARAPGP